MDPEGNSLYQSCSICGKSLSSTSAVNAHIRRMHSGAITVKQFGCNYCERVRTTTHGYSSTLLTMFFNQVFTRNESLKDHLLKTHNVQGPQKGYKTRFIRGKKKNEQALSALGPIPTQPVEGKGSVDLDGQVVIPGISALVNEGDNSYVFVKTSEEAR